MADEPREVPIPPDMAQRMTELVRTVSDQLPRDFTHADIDQAMGGLEVGDVLMLASWALEHTVSLHRSPWPE
jgi:hypothetical protein